jgi:predicted DNA-binding antitoxin AbrB/MazE fold protein
MVQVIAAIYEHGVFKPVQLPALSENTRVRLVVEAMNENLDEFHRQQAWVNLEQLWQTSTFNSQGDRLTRDQLHERR